MIFYISVEALLWPPPISRIMRGNLCLLPTPVSICIHFDALSRGVFVFFVAGGLECYNMGHGM